MAALPDPDYFRAREIEERAAAENATDSSARHAHLLLAERYAKLIAEGGSARLNFVEEQLPAPWIAPKPLE